MHFFLEYLPVHWAMWTVSYWVLAPPLGAIQSVSTCYTAHTDTRATQNYSPVLTYLMEWLSIKIYKTLMKGPLEQTVLCKESCS